MILIAFCSTSNLLEKWGKSQSFTVTLLYMQCTILTYLLNIKHVSQLGPQSYRILQIKISIFKVFTKAICSQCILYTRSGSGTCGQK